MGAEENTYQSGQEMMIEEGSTVSGQQVDWRGTPGWCTSELKVGGGDSRGGGLGSELAAAHLVAGGGLFKDQVKCGGGACKGGGVDEGEGQAAGESGFEAGVDEGGVDEGAVVGLNVVVQEGEVGDAEELGVGEGEGGGVVGDEDGVDQRLGYRWGDGLNFLVGAYALNGDGCPEKESGEVDPETGDGEIAA